MADIARTFRSAVTMADVVRTFRSAVTGRPKGLHYVLLLIAVLGTTSIAAAAEISLVDAAEQGNRAAALRLLAKGANPNLAGPDGTTAVMWAASNNDVELVRALIKAGANVTLKNQFGTSALTEAAIVGSAPIIDALLKAGADPNTKNPEGETPLMAAARSGQVEAGEAAVGRRGGRQRQRELRGPVSPDVGRGAEPGRDGEVPGARTAPMSTRAA